MRKLINKFTNMSDGIKSGAVYTFSTLLTRGLAIITVPVFTRLMTTEEVGVVNLYNSWYTMIGVFTTLSLTSGGYQLALKEFANKRDQYESSVLTITSLMSILVLFIYILNPTFWEKNLGLPRSLILLMIIGFLVAPARDFWMARQRYEYKYKLAGAVSIISAVGASAFAVFTVILMNKKGLSDVAEGRLLAHYVVIYGIAGCIWLYIMLKGRTFYNKAYWKFSLSLSVPLIGHSIAKQILDLSDRQMISKYVGNSAVGIYSTLYTVSSLSLIAWNAINASYIPYLYQNIDKTEKKKFIQKSSSILLALYAVIALLMAFFAPEIVKILATDEYYDAIYIMPPIAAGVFLTSVSNMYSNILVYYKKTQVIMFASGSAAVINLVLNALCIPRFGYQAAAYTTLIAYIALVLIEGILSTRIYKKNSCETEMVYSNIRITLMCLITIGISMLGLVLYKFMFIRYLICLVLFLTVLIIFQYHKKNGTRII